MPDQQFWNQRYIEKNTGWDLGSVSRPFVHLLETGRLKRGMSILIPGSGRSHEGIYLAREGFRVTVVDFAPEVTREVREQVAKEGVRMEVLNEDIFQLDPATHGTFDYLLEQTCFCAIDPERRSQYVEMAWRMLRPGGMLFGLFYAHGREGGPPWTTTPEEVRALFDPRFDFLEFSVTEQSVDSRKGEELLAFLRRRPG